MIPLICVVHSQLFMYWILLLIIIVFWVCVHVYITIIHIASLSSSDIPILQKENFIQKKVTEGENVVLTCNPPYSSESPLIHWMDNSESMCTSVYACARVCICVSVNIRMRVCVCVCVLTLPSLSRAEAYPAEWACDSGPGWKPLLLQRDDGWQPQWLQLPRPVHHSPDHSAQRACDPHRLTLWESVPTRLRAASIPMAAVIPTPPGGAVACDDLSRRVPPPLPRRGEPIMPLPHEPAKLGLGPLCAICN